MTQDKDEDNDTEETEEWPDNDSILAEPPDYGSVESTVRDVEDLPDSLLRELDNHGDYGKTNDYCR